MKCPRCKGEYDRLLALSRKDNKTMICDQCGTEEALEAAGIDDKQSFEKVMKPISKIIEEVCEDICDNYCKYRGTEDEDNICDMIRETGSCPLDRLF